MGSAICWAIVEERVREISIEHGLDVSDSLVEARVQAETAEHFEGQGETRARSLSETGGIAAGIDTNLEAQIIRRKEAARGAGAEVRQ